MARTQGCRLTCVTIPGTLTAALSTHHPAAGDLCVLLPASPPSPTLATGSLGHDIPIHTVVTQNREETHGSGHDLNPRIPGSLRDQHRNGDHMQLWDSGDGEGGQWCVPAEWVRRWGMRKDNVPSHSISSGECGGSTRSTRGCFQLLTALRHLSPPVETSHIKGEPGLSYVSPSAALSTPADPF